MICVVLTLGTGTNTPVNMDSSFIKLVKLHRSRPVTAVYPASYQKRILLIVVLIIKIARAIGVIATHISGVCE